jgi:ABC-type transporter Mla subunit MlaD
MNGNLKTYLIIGVASFILGGICIFAILTGKHSTDFRDIERTIDSLKATNTELTNTNKRIQSELSNSIVEKQRATERANEIERGFISFRDSIGKSLDAYKRASQSVDDIIESIDGIIKLVGDIEKAYSTVRK